MSNLHNPIKRVSKDIDLSEDCTLYKNCGGFDNHKLKCKACGKFMKYKDSIETFDSECDVYECECGMTASVSKFDCEHQVFWEE